MPVIMKDNFQYGYTTKGTVFHTLSNAEYEALTEEEKMNGDVYCIPDREPVINPDQLWEKVGIGTLDIGDDLTDGVNQLNSSLTPFVDNGWTCRKNADNSYECYISVDVTAVSSNTYGGFGLYFHESNVIKIPSVIKSQVIAKIANVQGGQLKILCGDAISISNHNMTLYYIDYFNTSGSSNRCTVGIHLIGK